MSENNVSRKNYYDPFYDLFKFPFDGDFKRNAFMKTDIEELDDKYRFNIEVPSVKKEDIKVSLTDGYLNVEVEKKNSSNNESENRKIIHKERFFGSYKRSYYVGDEVKEENISAKLEEGVLTLDVKKPSPKEEQSTKYIEIK